MSPEKINVLFTISFDEALMQRVRNFTPPLNVTVLPTRHLEDISTGVWEKAEILYTDSVLPNPGQAPRLRWIQFHLAGIDRHVNAPILKEPEIVSTTMSGASASQLGEYVLTGLLALGRHLPAMAASQANADWPADRWDRFSPRELRGSTVGIIGYGSIGRQVARLLVPFGATVLAAKRNAMETLDHGYTPEGMGDPEGILAHRIYPIQAIRSMVKECDFVVVATPLTNETRGLVDAEVIAAMKPGAYIIDVSRGGIIDHAALIKNLKSGRVAGAMLDVFPQEPLPPESPLWKMPNVIVTPHISGNSQHYNARAIDLFLANLQRYAGGLPLFNRFTPDLGY